MIVITEIIPYVNKKYINHQLFSVYNVMFIFLVLNNNIINAYFTIVSCNECLINCSCSRRLRSLLAVTANDVVTRVNPLQTAIASGSGREDSPCLSR